MQVKSRWVEKIVAEAARTTVKLPFERDTRRAALRARLLSQAASEKPSHGPDRKPAFGFLTK